GADLGQIPEHVAQLLLERFPVGRRDLPAVVAKDLLDLAGDFACFVSQTERRVGDGMVCVNQVPRSSRLLLVVVQAGDVHKASSSRTARSCLCARRIRDWAVFAGMS